MTAMPVPSDPKRRAYRSGHEANKTKSLLKTRTIHGIPGGRRAFVSTTTESINGRSKFNICV